MVIKWVHRSVWLDPPYAPYCLGGGLGYAQGPDICAFILFRMLTSGMSQLELLLVEAFCATLFLTIYGFRNLSVLGLRCLVHLQGFRFLTPVEYLACQFFL